MQKEAKFNYGFLLVSLAIPVIADYFLGRRYGVIAAIVVGVIGGVFLVSGHIHREKGDNAPMSRKKRLAAFAVIGAFLALGVIGIRAVFAHESTPKQSTEAPAKPAPQQTPPTAPPNTAQPKPKPSTGQSATATSKGDNSPAGAINQQGQGNTAIVGNNNTVGSSADEIANKVAERLGPTLKGGFHEIPDKIVVELGSGSAEDSYINAKRAGVLHPLQVGNSLPIEIRITNDDKILFTFKSWDAGLPIEVKDNEVKIGNDQVQRNFSANAFEVVNKAGEPLFQMIRKDAGTIHINGIFPTGKISQITGKPLLLWISDGTGLYWSSIKPNPWLKPIFKYPAWKYPGVFADN
jgi:hypothetical protein